MSLNQVLTGNDVPNDVNVVIEIPMNSEAVKYEVDKVSGAIFVDRLLTAPMRYPCNYGYVPHTLGGDGDPIDALVLMPVQLIPGCVVNCRPIGYLEMEDEGGTDEKLVVVPTDKISRIYSDVTTVRTLPPLTLDQISFFFEHYKNLEPGKWVEIKDWHGPDDARQVIVESIERFASEPVKPNF